MSMERAPHLSRYMLEVREYHKLMYLNQQIVYIAYILFSHHSCFSPVKTGATEKTVNDEESKEVGLGVGIVLAVIILAVVVALLVGVVWWYHK